MSLDDVYSDPVQSLEENFICKFIEPVDNNVWEKYKSTIIPTIIHELYCDSNVADELPHLLTDVVRLL